MSKSFLTEQKDLEKGRKWHLIDASEATLGRIASRAAVLLKGKHKRTFAPSQDCGDFVVIKNAAKLRLQARGGYALPKELDVKTDRGLRGQQLRFGHDEKKRPYQYWITLFVAGDMLLVVEAGGPEEQLGPHEAAITRAIQTLAP